MAHASGRQRCFGDVGLRRGGGGLDNFWNLELWKTKWIDLRGASQNCQILSETPVQMPFPSKLLRIHIYMIVKEEVTLIIFRVGLILNFLIISE